MSNTAAQLPPLMTVADFLNWPGDGTGVIFELVDGVVRALDPASDTHNTIFGNLQGHIWQHLRAHRPQCRVVPTAGLQPRLRANWNWRVPEIAVTCAPNRQGVHPTEGAILIAEILSHKRKRHLGQRPSLRLAALGRGNSDRRRDQSRCRVVAPWFRRQLASRTRPDCTE